MRNLLLLLLISIIVCSCNEVDVTTKASLSGYLEVPKIEENKVVSMDTTYMPTYGNGIKHFQPYRNFTRNFSLFQSLLQHFKYENMPFNLDAFEVDKTNEDWAAETALATEYFAYLIDDKAFQAVSKITNPRENLSDFYQVFPVAKFNERELFHTLLYVVRYLDGNGQQDIFYLTTFSNEGILLSGIEVGALQASAETYIKTAQIKTENHIKVHHAAYDETIKDWIKTSESDYFLDNTGQVYANYENIKIESAGSNTDVKGSVENIVAENKRIEFSNYFQLFQKELRTNSPKGLLNYITFPHFRVSYEEHFQDFRSKEAFILQYPIIFNEDFRKKIARQKFEDLIVNNDEIGLSDGSIWFKRIGRDNEGKLVVAIRVN